MNPDNASKPACAPQGAVVEARVQTEPAGRVTVVLRGTLDAQTTGPCWRDLEQRLRSLHVAALDVDASQLASCGAIGMSLLSYLCLGGMTPGARVTLRGLKAELQETLNTFKEQDWAAYRHQVPAKAPLPSEVGRAARTTLADLRAQVVFLGQVTAALASTIFHPKRLRWPVVKLIFETAGVNALPIVSLISFLVGLVIASETAHRLAQFGAQILVAGIIGFSMVRDLGPLMTAILMAGRSGSAFAAELGTMKVNEELDALAAMGLDPVRFLVVQRMAAGIVLIPLLTVYAMLMGAFGGALIMFALGYSLQEVFHEMAAQVGLSDIGVGLAKSVIFGIIVAGVGCLRGLQTGAGPTAVGVAATRAVVTSILLIIVTNAVFAGMGFLLHHGV